ncbi:hypothetical protein BsWGS_25058 [Bradybaena similaris]
MSSSRLTPPLLLAVIIVFCHVVSGEVIALNENNVDSVLASSDIAIVNFYADWCRFSQILAPVFEEAAKKVHDEFPVPGKIVFAKVDCDRETNIGTRFHISKYPTLKVFRGGTMIKKEYRGQRSAEALASFMTEQAKDPVHEVANVDDLDQLETKKRNMIAYVASKVSDSYRTFVRVASILRDDCNFYAAVGDISQAERTNGDFVSFRPPNTMHQDLIYTGSLTDFTELYQWCAIKCVPIVREITFENAEELTEEGLPFLILFHHPDDTASVDLFTQEVHNQLLNEKANVNFLVADGIKFAHPLHHLGKSTSDLPLLAIDSFRHMYLFPHNVKTDITKPGILKRFIEDLHSGKLHREFHHGPDPTEVPESQPAPHEGVEHKNIPRDTSDDPKPQSQPKITSPPESTFKKLAPSRNRYTILRDEL